MKPAVVVDYGMGNLHSVHKALLHLGCENEFSQDPDEIRNAERIILPGVGAFLDAMAELNRLNLVGPIREAVQKGVPLIGICLGMQLLFEYSTEGGRVEGLGLLPGGITLMQADGLKVPHMGWNTVQNRDSVLFANLPAEFSVYFVHSYCFQPVDKPFVAGVTVYGQPFACAAHWNNVFAAQFHPEKSGDNGLQILRNFLAYEGGAAC
jgi:glutamine amidotransferase